MTKSVEPAETRRWDWLSILAGLATVGGIATHLWAGWIDENRLVLQPVGHGTVMSFYAWATTGALAVFTLFRTRGRSTVAVAALTFAGVGIILLVTA